MADRKAKSLTFKVPPGTNLGTLKEAIENENANNEIKVFQATGANEYLIEMTSETQAQEMIENGSSSRVIENLSNGRFQGDGDRTSRGKLGPMLPSLPAKKNA